MGWTALHQALGETSGELTFALVEQAVKAGVQETASLDWKAVLPLSTQRSDKHRQQYELAKDIAAMANSGGGLIVYGVGERTVEGRTTAGGLTEEFVVTSDDQKRIQQVAFSSIQPPVRDLEMRELRSEDGNRVVLAMLIPESRDAPHLIIDKRDGGFFQAPWRSGPETFFMGERQLAAAYRQREQGRKEHLHSLDELHQRFLARLDIPGSSAIWTIAVARPAEPSSSLRRMDPQTAERVFVQASNAPWVSHASTAITEAKNGHTTRRGHRHYYWTSKREIMGRTIRSRVEVHMDGSLAVGITRDGLLHRDDIEPSHVRVDDIENTGLDLLALILTARAAGGPHSDFDVILDVSPEATIFRRPDPFFVGHYVRDRESDSFPAFHPVIGTIITDLGRQELLQSALDVIEDAMNQVNNSSAWNVETLASQISINRSEFFCIE